MVLAGQPFSCVRPRGAFDCTHSVEQAHIVMARPTNLVSLLVAFRMGFRSLAIQQRSGEVWTVLSAVKTEFGKFGGMLDKVSRKLREAQSVVDDEAGVRRRAIVVPELPCGPYTAHRARFHGCRSPGWSTRPIS
jgi:hypothetical protein